VRLSPSIALLRTQSDERLVKLVREGSDLAFTTIVERHRRAVLGACRRILPEARAEDAAQQVYMAAWKGLARGDDVRDVRAWLLRIARNTSLNALRVQGFDYDELREATQAALRGATVVTTGRDPHFPMPDGPWPGTGAVVAAVEAAAGVSAVNVGKPEAPIVQAALDRLGPGRALFVGDRIDSDLGAAANAGVDGALVLTGGTSSLAAHRAEGAVAVRDSLADLVLA